MMIQMNGCAQCRKLLCWGALTLSALMLGGCESLLKGPEPEPTPTPVSRPLPDVFDANDGVTTGDDKVTKLNDNDPASTKLPDKFRVARVDTGELLAVQSLSTLKAGNPPRDQIVLGVPDVVRLAGIVTPPPGQPGFGETIARIQRWTLGQDVDVEQDARFPVDLSSRRMVQIFFTGREGKTKGTRMLLNRMLVRLGYAVVDLNSPTTIDTKPWLNDEEFARRQRLGLWGKNIVLGQRLAPPQPKGANVPMQRINTPRGKNLASSTRVRSRIETSVSGTTTAPVAPVAPVAPPAGAPAGVPPAAPPAAAPVAPPAP